MDSSSFLSSMMGIDHPSEGNYSFTPSPSVPLPEMNSPILSNLTVQAASNRDVLNSTAAVPSENVDVEDEPLHSVNDDPFNTTSETSSMSFSPPVFHPDAYNS